MKKILHLIVMTPFVLFISLAACAQPTPLGKFKGISLGAASCRATDSTLIINSGQIERTYRLTPGGLLTVGLRWPDGKQQVLTDTARQADWDMGFTDQARLHDITATIDDDSGFTSRHITVTSEFEYAGAGIKLRYVIWVYPGSGIRTQLELKGLKSDGQPIADFENRQVEHIPVRLRDAVITAFGYYNDTERRNKHTTPILKEEQELPDATVNWANGVMVRYGSGGLILVKESHKCVNQPGIATGGFDMKPDGIVITGLGLAHKDIDTSHYIKCWANWIIPYKGDSTGGLLALKKFDRMRYPVRKNDIYIMANTWGSGYSRHAAREENVLREIDVQADLGIDVQQIDDGWEDQHWRPVANASFYSTDDSLHPVKYDVYPDGWAKVKQYASRKGVQLGLWAAAGIPEKDLEWNYEQGGFSYYKLDGSYLDTKKKLDNLNEKARSFMLYTHHGVRVNLDVTENSPRFGYFYAREFGNVFLENREPVAGSYADVIYRPQLVLRDAWQLAKYINLNKFQIPVQNVGKVNNLESDAFLYTNAYAVAIALMSSPVFFEETHFYSEKDRATIKNILRVYKQHREEMFTGYVSPIGDTPDNASWTGFQDVVSAAGTGYLLLFRELHNENKSQRVRLQLVHNQFIELTDLLTGQKEKIFVDKAGFANFSIAKPADFRFYRYEVK